MNSFLYKVLVIDDEPVTRRVIERYVEKNGLRPITASTGVEGLLKAFSEEPHLVFIDLNLPDTSGTDIILTLRNDGFIAAIVAMSADDSETTRKHCLDMGASAYLSKPASGGEISALLERYIDSDSDGGVVAPILSSMEEEDDVIQKIVAEFLDSLDGRVKLIQRSISDGDWEEAAKLSHKLKGAGLFGFPELSEVAGRLEQATKNCSLEQSTIELVALASLVSRVNLGRQKSQQDA